MLSFIFRMHLSNKKDFINWVVIIISIIGILSPIGLANFGSIRESASKIVCNYNTSSLNKDFQVYLVSNGIDNNMGNPHASFLLQKDLQESGGCSAGGMITYLDGSFHCNIHTFGDETHEEDDEVPYL